MPVPILIYTLQGVIVFCVLVVENFLVIYGLINPAQAQLLIVTAIALLMTMLLFSTMRFDYLALSRVIQKASLKSDAPVTKASEVMDLSSFNKHFQEGRLYREPGLTISQLAEQLHVPQYRLREFIHETLGHRNFNAMLHHYRIAEASEILADPENCNIPILTVALSIGYQSITPFNSAFRDINGAPPSEYRRQKLQV